MTYDEARVIERLRAATTSPELSFSMEEYVSRLEALRARMDRDDVATLLVTSVSDIGYLTGYDTAVPSAYATLVVPREGEVFLHCADLEASAMLRTGYVGDVTLFAYHETPEPAVDLAHALAGRGMHRGRIGVQLSVPETIGGTALDAASYLRLREMLVDAELIDSALLGLEGRLIKSPAEIEHLRTAASYTVAGTSAGLNAAREGATENEIAAAVYAALMAAGSENPSLDPLILVGERTGWAPHLAFRRTPVATGDTVYLELTGTHLRYNAPQCRTASIGPASAALREQADDSLRALDSLISHLEPGRTPAQVMADVRRQAAFRTTDTANSGTFGYSVGMAFKPCWTENPYYLNASNTRVLEPGMVLHTPISVYRPGVTSAIFSETIVITDAGCEVLTEGGPERSLRCL